jgi:hypothetical protein
MTLGFTGGHRDWSQATVLGVGESLNASAWPVSSGTNQSPGKITLSPDGSTLTIPVALVTKSWDFLT